MDTRQKAYEKAAEFLRKKKQIKPLQVSENLIREKNDQLNKDNSFRKEIRKGFYKVFEETRTKEEFQKKRGILGNQKYSTHKTM